MDLELPEFLKQACSPESHPLRGLFQRVLASSDDIPGVAADELGIADATAARLLWLSSHYLSPAATSHGLQLAYVEGGAEHSALLTRLGALARELPSKLVLTAIRHGEGFWRRHVCGGEQSAFERHDLRFLEHDPQSEHRLGALVIRWEASAEVYPAFVDALLAAQRVMAFVLVLRPADVPAPALRALGDGWSLDHVDAVPGATVVDVHCNRNWIDDIRAARDLRYGHPPAPAGGAPEKTLPLVRVKDFAGATVLDSLPSETLAGAEMSLYGLDAQGIVTANRGRLAAVQTQERIVYALDDVNVSHTGVIWRDDRVLFESLKLQGHDNGWLRETSAIVTEPAHTLEGTYFLAPTGNTHHSHLMWETLRRLNIAEALGEDVRILTSSILSPSQREYFPLFGFPPERIVYKHPEETCRVERLIITNEASQRYDRASVDYLRRIAAAYYERPSTRPTRLYLSRRDSRINRNMVNQEEIETLFQDHGFAIVVASDLSAHEKIALFSTAEIVAGPLGAAFTYLPFAQNASAIILTTEGYFPPVHLEMAAVQRARIDCVHGIGLSAYTDPWGYEHTSFYMPPELVEIVLEQRLKRG